MASMSNVITPKIKDRFFKKIKFTNGCWEWQGDRFVQGYGAVTINKKKVKAHRISFLIFNGKFPKYLCVLHKCDNRKCVNPKHLFLGTRKDNNHDRSQKNRSGKGMRHPHCKTTDGDVKKIKRLYNDGVGQNKIAKKFNISQTLVSLIINKKQRVLS